MRGTPTCRPAAASCSARTWSATAVSGSRPRPRTTASTAPVAPPPARTEEPGPPYGSLTRGRCGASPPYARLMGQRVLVDDDQTVSDVVRRYLERAGFAVTLAADGQTALRAYEAERPDLVVLDLMLPGIDGLEVCRRLRTRADEVPIVMLTALGEEADRVLGLQLGADDYVTKPFSPRELVLRVQS